MIDLTGDRFGRLIATKLIGKDAHGNAQWLCQCDCGNEHTVSSHYLRRGSSTSCGCRRKEEAAKIIKARFPKVKPPKPSTRNHGLSETKLYKVHTNMRQRVHNETHPQYKDYGGRGVSICDEWDGVGQKFLNFYDWALTSGYTEGLTLDREDVEKGYSPSNCRWVDMKTQCNNRRSNVTYTYEGKTMTSSEWSRSLGGTNDLVRMRIQNGWTVDRALSTPVVAKKQGYRKKTK